MFFLFVPNIGFAHTHLKTANPENGAVVKEPIEEVVLTFDTEIEKLSTMTLTKDGEPVEIATETITDNQLTGKVGKPLENGQYEVKWNIIGADGHVMKDTISFEVDADKPTTEKEQTEQKNEVTEEPLSPNKQPQSETANETSTPFFFVAFIVLLFIIGVSVLFFLRKRKKG